jgi:hypothetical protein
VTETIERIAAMPCAHCGGPKPTGRGRLYCSKQCRDNAYEARQREMPAKVNGQSPAIVNGQCRGCGAPTEARYKPRVWCSDVCRKRTERQPVPAQPDWTPERGDNSVKAAARRRELIRELAFRGHSSRQIGERINMNDQTVRAIARELSIAIPADEVVRKSRRHDSGRILRETAQALEGLVMGISLVNPEEVDPAEAKQWATSLTSSIRALNRFTNQIREMTQ